MDRQSISSLVFDDNDGANNYINTHHFGLQRAMQGLENITTDLRQFKERTRDYFDDTFDYHNKRMDKHMEEIQ